MPQIHEYSIRVLLGKFQKAAYYTRLRTLSNSLG